MRARKYGLPSRKMRFTSSLSPLDDMPHCSCSMKLLSMLDII